MTLTPMTKFNFVDDVWTDQSGRRVTVELSESGGHVRVVLHAMEDGPIAEFTLATYRARRLWEGLSRAIEKVKGDTMSKCDKCQAPTKPQHLTCERVKFKQPDETWLCFDCAGYSSGRKEIVTDVMDALYSKGPNESAWSL